MARTLSLEVKRFSRALWSAIGTPLSHRLILAMDRGDWDYIANCRVDPKDFSSAVDYFLDAQASSLLRKLEDLPLDPKLRRARALKNWRKGEHDCYRTNERLAPYLEGKTHPSCDPDVLHHLDGIRKIVKSILGRAPSMESLLPRFGPGATFSDPAARSTIADKMNVSSTLTPGAKWFLLNWMGTQWGRLAADATPQRSSSFVRGNRFAVAPKDALKDRAIAAEPGINVFYQLGLGQEVRRLLKRVGIDLDSGQDKHRQVACASSISGRLATLDLSNASDTLAYSLVRLLLPPDWFELFDELRSPFTRMDHKDLNMMLGAWPLVDNEDDHSWVKLEKFSSMGNGFTFELETLIFYSIVKYAGMALIDDDDEQTLVYGDDIICRADIVEPVTKILAFLGFTLNTEKSFGVGPFRESCGGDYFNGQAVRPYFMKEAPCEPQHFIAAANAVRRAFEESPVGFDRARSSWFNLLDNIPVEIRRCRGPKGLGDLCIHDDETRWLTRERSHSLYVRVYRPAKYRKIPFKLFDDSVVLACAVYGVPWSKGYIMPRDPVSGYKCGWIVAYGVPWTPEVVVVPNSAWERDEFTLNLPFGGGPSYRNFKVIRST